jgi:hypothetical protein
VDTLTLERIYTDTGAFGWLGVGNNLIHTVERPWRDNEPFISCIPEGLYVCKPRRYNKGGYEAIEVIMPEDSPRSHILFHKANHPEELAGCIAPNMDLRFVNGKGRGEKSREAFNILMAKYRNESFVLKITKRG